MYLATLDKLIQKLIKEIVFYNNFNNREKQIHIDQQLFTTLIQIGFIEMEYYYQKLMYFIRWKKA